MIAVEQLARIPGAALSRLDDHPLSRVVTDSRDAGPGTVFFALLGERDGHDFLPAAVANGVGAVVVEASRDLADVVPDEVLPDEVLVVRVPDTLRALQQLGAIVRADSTADVLAVTGSVGKTTTKNLLVHVLSPDRAVLGSPKSFNNHLGVPLTLLQLEASHTDLVAEVGTNHPDEIAALIDLVRPRVALVTNVGHAHLGNFGSREALAAEKTSIYAGVEPGGVWVVNADDPLVVAALADLPRPEGTRVLTFGTADDADVRVSDVRVTPSGTTATVHAGGMEQPLSIPLVGQHFALTAASAVAIALERGLDLDDVLARIATFPAPEGRGAITALDDGHLHLIDDSYNGSPDSMLAALDTLSTFADGRRVAVLGEMRELGDWSGELHRTVAERAAQTATDLVFIGGPFDVVRDAAVGAGLPADRVTSARSATHAAAAVQTLLDSSEEDAAVLVKGSRFVHTERVALALEGVDVRCTREVCPLYIHCSTCDLLHVD